MAVRKCDAQLLGCQYIRKRDCKYRKLSVFKLGLLVKIQITLTKHDSENFCYCFAVIVTVSKMLSLSYRWKRYEYRYIIHN